MPVFSHFELLEHLREAPWGPNHLKSMYCSIHMNFLPTLDGMKGSQSLVIHQYFSHHTRWLPMMSQSNTKVLHNTGLKITHKTSPLCEASVAVRRGGMEEYNSSSSFSVNTKEPKHDGITLFPSCLKLMFIMILRYFRDFCDLRSYQNMAGVFLNFEKN